MNGKVPRNTVNTILRIRKADKDAIRRDPNSGPVAEQPVPEKDPVHPSAKRGRR